MISRGSDPSGFDLAFAEAEAAGARGEVPIGAAILLDGRVIGRGGNRTRQNNDPTAHAEIVAIRMACTALGSERIGGAGRSRSPDARWVVTPASIDPRRDRWERTARTLRDESSTPTHAAGALDFLGSTT